jgi:ferredoxin
MVEVTFVLEDGTRRSVEVEAGAKITQVAYALGIHIQQTCGGTPSCTDCMVQILEEDPSGSLEEMLGPEKRLLGNVYHLTKERLACQAVIRKSLTVKILKIEVKKREERE